MKKIWAVIFLVIFSFTGNFMFAENVTPLKKHGRLSVVNGSLVDKKNKPYQLYGMSTHGVAWYPQYIKKETFQTLRDDWNTNCVRLALYTYEYNGYCSGGKKNSLKNYIYKGIDYATELGMYVIVDWHVLNDKNPEIYREEARAFFEEVSAKYKKHKNIIYEICNEPNGQTSWADIVSYANYVIPAIRKNNKKAIVIVGTPSWCQKIDEAQDWPLKYNNVMYAVHFYANTHRQSLRTKVQNAVDAGLPVFVSEFGTCNASGDGVFNKEETIEWLNLLDENNISYFNWSLSNKKEIASALKSGCTKTSNWTSSDLTESGNFIRAWFRKKGK